MGRKLEAGVKSGIKQPVVHLLIQLLFHSIDSLPEFKKGMEILDPRMPGSCILIILENQIFPSVNE